MFCPLYLAYSFFYTRNSIHQEILLTFSWSFKHIHCLTTSHDPPLLPIWATMTSWLGLLQCLPVWPPHSHPCQPQCRFTPLLKIVLCFFISFRVKSWVLMTYLVLIASISHYLAPTPAISLASLQFLKRSKHSQDLCTCCSSSLRLFIQVSFWLALSLHCNLCLYVIMSHIRYHIREGPSWSPAVTAPITSILHSGLFPFFLFYHHCQSYRHSFTICL